MRNKIKLSVRCNVNIGWTTGVPFPAEAMMIFFSLVTASRSALGPTQSPVQWVTGDFRASYVAGCEADHTPLYSADVKNVWSHNFTP